MHAHLKVVVDGALRKSADAWSAQVILHAARTANTRVAGVLGLRRRWLWSRRAAVWDLEPGLRYCGGCRKLRTSCCNPTQYNRRPAGGHRLATNWRRGIAWPLFVRAHRRAVHSHVMAGRERRCSRHRLDASPIAPVVAWRESERQGRDSGQKSDEAAQSHERSLTKHDEKRRLLLLHHLDDDNDQENGQQYPENHPETAVSSHKAVCGILHHFI